MTVVANFSLQTQPVLIGDLLISRWFENPPNASPFHVPTVRDVNSIVPTEWGWIATALRQKVVLLGNQLALGWAGSQLAARYAVHEIQNHMTNGIISLDRIQAVLEALDLGQQELFISGVLVKAIEQGTHAVIRFAWDSHCGWLEPLRVLPTTGSVYAGGTGRDDFVRILQTVASDPSPFSRTTTKVEAAILLGITATNILAGEQMRVGAGLASLYGGGFEIATVVDGKVTKIGDITHFFLDAVRLEDGKIKVHLRLAITYWYQGDILLVGTLELQMEWVFESKQEPSTLTMSARIQGEPAIYAILPVHRSLGEEERSHLADSPPVLQFSSRFTSLYVHLPQRKNLVKSLAHYAGLHTPALGIRLDGESADISIRTELLAKIDAMLTLEANQ